MHARGGGLVASELFALQLHRMPSMLPMVAPCPTERASHNEPTGTHRQRGRGRRTGVSLFSPFVATRGFPDRLTYLSVASTRWGWHSPDDCFRTVSPSVVLLCRLGCRVSDRLSLGRGWLGRLVLFPSLSLSPLPTKRRPRVDIPANAESICGGEWTLLLERNQGGTWRTRG